MTIPFAIALWLGLWATAKGYSDSVISDAYPSLDFIYDLRREFLESITARMGDPGALVAGLAIGERGLLSEDAQEAMKTVSLTHLVAVSGANLAIVMATVWFLLASIGLGRHSRFALSLLAMAFYVLLVGPESSVIRASVMALFVTVSLWLGRGSSALHALALAVIAILVIDQSMATDFGFALSALATVGLLIGSESFYERLRAHLPDFLALGLSTTFSAQLFTIPILLMLQPGLPLYSAVANLLVEPVVAPITVLGIAAVLTAHFPVASAALIHLASWLTGFILLIAQNLATWPFARIPFLAPPAGVLTTAAIVILVVVAVRSDSFRVRRGAGLLAGSIGLVSLLVSGLQVFTASSAIKGWELLNCDVGQGDALMVKSRNQVMLVDVGPKPGKIQACLEQSGVNQLNLLILTHYDFDHVGGISGLARVGLDVAIVSGFQDDRPMVSVVSEELVSKGARVSIGQAGMKGNLGDCAWEILSPSFRAEEFDNSNDASLVSWIDCPDFQVLGLADLSEHSQQLILTNVTSRRVWTKPLILKVAHHGSADQSRELIEAIRPEIAILSVGPNTYGHPTDRVLRILHSSGALTFRTDRQGMIAVAHSQSGLIAKVTGKLAE